VNDRDDNEFGELTLKTIAPWRRTGPMTCCTFN
jgi:hypothetical protein